MKNFHTVYYNHFIQFPILIDRYFRYLFLRQNNFKDKKIDMDEVKNSKFWNWSRLVAYASIQTCMFTLKKPIFLLFHAIFATLIHVMHIRSSSSGASSFIYAVPSHTDNKMLKFHLSSFYFMYLQKHNLLRIHVPVH